MLKYLQATIYYSLYQEIIIETADFDLEKTTTGNTDFFKLDLHPDGSQKFDFVKTFDKEFDRNIFYQLTISLALKKQFRHHTL